MATNSTARITAKLSTTSLLTRHILRTMGGHKLRTFMVWLSLASALAVIIGVVSFVQSIDDSFKARGAAVRGVADLQVQAVERSTFSPDLAGDLEKVRGTRYAIAIDELRIAIKSAKRQSVVATAYGIDRRARRLRSSLQRQLNVRTPRDPSKGGLTISTVMAAQLGVERGDRVRILAYRRSPSIKIQRVVRVAPALYDVVALPRKSVESLRGSEGRPNAMFIKLKPGTSVNRWRKRAAATLPANALVVSPSQQQHELDTVLNFTTRSYTYVFGAVALLIGTLLVYVLQLMRMLDRQEDAGLVRALGSGWGPLAAAEVMTMAIMLVTALPAGLFFGHMFAHRLSANLPDFLMQVFNFTLHLQVRAPVVIGAMVATLLVAAFATIGALATTRQPVADQMGRAPQSGGTSTARISTAAAAALTIGGLACYAIAVLLTKQNHFTATALLEMAGIGLFATGFAALLIQALAHFRHDSGTAGLVARSALESHQRRVGMSVAIMALAVAAVIPLQLLDSALQERLDRLATVYVPDVKRIVAGSDMFNTVQIRPDYARKALKEKRKHKKKAAVRHAVPVVPGQPPPTRAQLRSAAARERRAIARERRTAARRELHRPMPRYASPFATGFTRYRDQRISTMALDSRNAWPYTKTKEGITGQLSTIRRHRDQVIISAPLASWAGLKAGDSLSLPTARGMKKLKISAVVDDIGWPMGTVYFDITRFRELYGWSAINALLAKPGKVDNKELRRMRPLHTYDGVEQTARIERQMEMTRSNMLAMRMLIVFAALVAVSGILATSVLARRREWGVLRAVGMTQGKLLAALAIEIVAILLLGAAIGVAGGIVTYEGPIIHFMKHQGFPVGTSVDVLPLLSTAVVAIGVGLVAVMVSAVLVARTRLTDALSYE